MHVQTLKWAWQRSFKGRNLAACVQQTLNFWTFYQCKYTWYIYILQINETNSNDQCNVLSVFFAHLLAVFFFFFKMSSKRLLRKQLEVEATFISVKYLVLCVPLASDKLLKILVNLQLSDAMALAKSPKPSTWGSKLCFSHSSSVAQFICVDLKLLLL